jgi:hypothetical protein
MGVLALASRPSQSGPEFPGELAVIGFQGRENVRHSKNGKSQLASMVATRHNVRFEAQKRTRSQKKEIS